MKRFIKSKKGIALLATIAVAALASAAFAYFTTTGTGTGSASVGTSTGLAIVQKGSVTGLLPGTAAQAIEYTIDNNTSSAQYVGVPTVSISSVTGPNITTGTPCSASDFTLVQPTQVPGDIPAGTTFDSTNPGPASGASIAMIDSTSNQNGCKGATVNLAFSA